MTVLGNVKLHIVPKGTCDSFCLRAIVPDSIRGSKGLLGYPDMVRLGMLPQHFPLVITHSCSNTADLEGGKFPTVCGEMEGDGQIKEGRVGKVLGVDGRIEDKKDAGKLKRR